MFAVIQKNANSILPVILYALVFLYSNNILPKFKKTSSQIESKLDIEEELEMDFFRWNGAMLV